MLERINSLTSKYIILVTNLVPTSIVRDRTQKEQKPAYKKLPMQRRLYELRD